MANCHFVGIAGRSSRAQRNGDAPRSVSGMPSSEVLSVDGGCLRRTPPRKFERDKVFDEDDQVAICADAILFNAEELKARHAAGDNLQLLKTLTRDKKVGGLGSLRGSFAGVLVDKAAKTWHLFTDHLGSKQLFYHWDNPRGQLLFATDLNLLVDAMRRCGHAPSLCPAGAYFLLHYGYMLGQYTLVQGVNRLPPGTLLTFDGRTVDVRPYFRLDNTPRVELSIRECVDTAHELFCQAVRREYDKDREYGYRHVATLSGGLDSRMNVLCAKQLGYDDVLAVTFSQSGYPDERIARRIASDCDLRYLYHSLDGGDYLRDVESPVTANGGLVYYPGSAHLLSMLRLLNWHELGLLHTGMLGDAILGTYLRKAGHEPPRALASDYSPLLAQRVESISPSVAAEFPNEELFKFYNRGVNGIFNGYWTTQRFTECASPFMDVDFLQFVLSVPPEVRYGGRLYRAWMLTHVKTATKYVHERTGCSPATPPPMASVVRLLWDLRRKLCRVSNWSPRYSMNPFEYWWKVNPALRQDLDSYYNSHLPLLDKYPELKRDCRARYEHGTFLEKGLSLTLLAAVKLHQLL